MPDDGTRSRERNPTSNWRALTAAWLGWAFDGLDGYLYVMVALPFVTKLVANEHGVALGDAAGVALLKGEIGTKAAMIQAVFLAGWACGGAVFGRVGDRLGRSRTLTLTILTYALFTGLSFFAGRWWHLLIFRFLAALGIGGEWAAGSALVCETLHSRHRAWASATLQTGYIVGCILAAATSGLIGTLKAAPETVFLVGIAPALLVVWIRSAVPEPREWVEAAAGKAPPRVRELFAPGLRRTTVLLLIHISIALTTAWAFLFFTPQMVAALPGVSAWPREEVESLKMRVTISYFVVNIAGNYAATYLARAIGYRRAFFVMTAGALATILLGFGRTPTESSIYVVTGAMGFFGLGLFAMFPLYVPPLFPTLLRTLGSGITYNVGRLTAAAGTFGTAWLASRTGGPTQAIWYVGLLYVPMLVGCLLLPEPGRARDACAENA